MARLLIRLLGPFILLCGLAPMLYGIANISTMAMCLLGGFVLFLPRIWPALGNLRALRTLLGAGLGVFVLYCAVVSAFMAHRAWFCRPPDSGGATAVVLGAKVNGFEPSLMLRRRLDVAAAYLEANPDADCVVTGGQGPDEEYPEADVMAAYLERKGIDLARILVENRSTSTRENFRFAAAYLAPGRPVVIVTDSFHQLRASLYARAECGNAGPLYALSSYTPWGLIPYYWFRDMMGILVALLQFAAT